MRIRLEQGHSSTKTPPAFMTVDDLPDVGETLRTENSVVFNIKKGPRANGPQITAIPENNGPFCRWVLPYRDLTRGPAG